MRSLTLSSADTSQRVIEPTPPIPHTPPSSDLLLHASPPQLFLPAAHRPHPVVTPSNHNPFFNVDTNTLALSPQSRNQVNQAIRSGWASSTMKRYSGAIDQFIGFCDAEGVPNHLRFPADEFVLCAFAASSIGIHSKSTPRNRLSALKAWHIAHNMEWKGSSRLRYVLNGVHNLAPGSSRRPPRPPVNARMIAQLVQPRLPI